MAEILHQEVPLLQQLGLTTSWEVIQGDPFFFAITKTMHNGLQGEKVNFTQAMMDHYLEVNRENARGFKWQADFVLLHDPQPAPLIREMRPQGKYWIWRCHIDASRPNFQVWRFLREIVSEYDASVFSMSQFAQDLPHPQYLIRPSIDPLSEKNRELTEEEIKAVLDRLEIERDKPIILQVSRFDSFKDPLGVIQRLPDGAAAHPLQAGAGGRGGHRRPGGSPHFRGSAGSGPGRAGHPGLASAGPTPTTKSTPCNAGADIIVQKSTREGFGLTVTEAMWKGKPVIGGAAGGIVLQLQDYNTGFLVHTPEGCAFRIRYLLHRPEMARRIGQLARELVRSHFLITRTLRDYLTLMILLDNPGKRLIEL